MSKATEKIDALIAELEQSGADPARLDALRCTQRFKRSWLELAETLVRLRELGAAANEDVLAGISARDIEITARTLKRMKANLIATLDGVDRTRGEGD